MPNKLIHLYLLFFVEPGKFFYNVRIWFPRDNLYILQKPYLIVYLCFCR